MSLTHTNQLFSRDLKHLVDPKYSAAPLRRHWSLASLIAIAALVGAGIWLLSAALMPLVMTESPTAITHSDSTSQPPRQTEPPQNAEQSAQQAGATEDKSLASASRTATSAQSVTDRAVAASAETTGVAKPHGKDEALVWVDYKVKNGDSLARIFKNHKLPTGDAIRIAEHKDAKEIQKLMPGQQLRIAYDEDKQLRALIIELRSNKSLTVGLAQDGSLQFSESQAEYDKREKTISAVIDSSLFKAGARAGLQDGLIMEMVSIYGWDVDFAMDMKKGDRFTLIYEELFAGKTSKGTGTILAAEFHNQDRRLFAFRHVNDNGLVEYFDEEGNNLRGTFLRTPMKISRITSGFSKNRLHPILQEWREHKGVDYAAPRGTPVLATADGRVSFLGHKEGYGKTVVLRHGGEYATLYAHLSSYKSKLKPGSNIKQGQIIGFVGKTGMATAPHLHYEFQVNGAHHDPLSYESPRASPIPAQERDRFLANAERWMEAMAERNNIELAQINTQSQ